MAYFVGREASEEIVGEEWVFPPFVAPLSLDQRQVDLNTALIQDCCHL